MAETAQAPAPAAQQLNETEANQWAMFTHLSALAGLIVPFGTVLGPLVLWLMKREQSSTVDAHGKAAVNFQISMAIYAFGAFIIGFLTLLILIGVLFFIVGALVALFAMVMAIIAAIKAGNGEAFEYPLTIQFLK